LLTNKHNHFCVLQQAIADKWFQKGPTVVAFDDKLQYYYKTIDEVDIEPLVKDQECIRLHMGLLFGGGICPRPDYYIKDSR
jgi:hypothetical protein